MANAEKLDSARITELEAMKEKGLITEQEFIALRSGAIRSSHSTPKSELLRWILLVCLIVANIAVDHLKGPVFPDFVYCSVGAGVEIKQPAQRRANGWMAGNGCSAPDPRCATSWVETPASSMCLHGTLWDEWKKNLM